MVDTYVADNMDMFFSSILIATVVVGTIISIILIMSWYKLFEKNERKGWKAIIPIYNIYILMTIAEVNPLSIFLLLVPIVNLFVLALLSVKLANKYNRSALFAIGLLFFPFIFYPILAFSKKEREEIVEDKKEINIEQIKKPTPIIQKEIKKPEAIKEPEKINKSIEEIENKVVTKPKTQREESSKFKEILKVNDYTLEPKKEKKETQENPKTLEEILKVKSISPIKEKIENKIVLPEKSRDLNAEVDQLLKMMEEMNKKEKGKDEKEEALKDSYICESCGSIVPRFAKKCLLCGSDKMRK